MGKEVFIVPEPKRLKFTGKWFTFNGFSNFPVFLKTEFAVPEGDWIISRVEGAGEESKLKIGYGKVTICGAQNICYATLIQLIIQGRGYLPEVEVEESFKFKFRGYHLDIARGGVPRIETFKRMLRLLFLLKYNYFAIYFEDLFPWRSYPQIGAHRGRLSEEELREIIDYGSKLGIEVFPSLELSGHMENILSLPEFMKFSEWHNSKEGCLDLSNDEARDFAYKLLEEAIGNFPSAKYIHVGGDETWALGRGRSLNKTWIFEGPQLYEMHHKEIINRVLRSGKEPILWGDMISGMYLREEAGKWGEILKSDVWRRSLIANWDYSPCSKEYFRNKIRIFKDQGLKQIVCPGLSNWNRYYPNFDLAIENLRNFLSAAAEENIEGFLVTAWGDDGEECLFSFLDPLILAAMEFAEGQGSWEKKWLAVSCENDKILESRVLFGKKEFSDVIKHVIFKDYWYNRLSEDERKRILMEWKKMLENVKSVQLPKDLDFIRSLLALGIKIIEGEAKVSDFITLSNIYMSLWLEERKPEGLERIIERFWGMAGKLDADLSRRS
ncbi:MAG: beta-N-acetylhexosaminidase [Candidatus Bathyarchaeota archaeon]|nr:beta-N-acetylhexosaminidase [Candidatus Bathyarchaeota archaeon]